MTRFGLKLVRVVCLVACCALPVFAVCCVGVASATEPWWHVSPTSRPTNLWTAKQDVQELTTEKNSSGVFAAGVELAGKPVGCLGSSVFCSADFGFSGDETAAQLQGTLESAQAYGPGGVEVTGGPVGRHPFVVTGLDPDRYAPPIELVLKQGTGRAGVLTQGGSGRLALIVTNLGDKSAEGATSPVRITDMLPSGVTALHAEAPAGAVFTYGAASCSVESANMVSCSFSGVLPPFESIEMEIEVALTSGTPVEGTELGTVTVSGGGAPAVSVPQHVRLSPAPNRFGMENYSFLAEEEGGIPDIRAGSHPFQLTTILNFDQGPVVGTNHREEIEEQPAIPRNLRFKLPAGVVANATSQPQCSEAQFLNIIELINSCPTDSAVGAAAITIIEHLDIGLTTVAVPVFNMVPAEGEPVRFGFVVLGVPVILNTSVRTGEGYDAEVSIDNTTEVAQFLGSVVTFWGSPGDHRHDSARGINCVYFHPYGSCSRPESVVDGPYLRLPTSCGVPLSAPMELEPWNVPLGSEIMSADASSPALGGCNHIPFEPRIETAVDAQQASSPSGLTVHVRLPQNENAEGLAEADVRNTTVTLPEGVALNPSDADGLESCSESEIGFRGVEPTSGEYLFTPKIGSPFCPDSSKVGTVKITSPLLPNPLEGAVYLATPAPNGETGMNPFNSLVAMYIVAEDPAAGILVKLPGKVVPNPVTGQLVSTFDDTPQLPFDDLELHFFGGGRAPLSTPARCGTYTTSSVFESWAGGEPSTPESTFEITSGPNGGPCPGATLPFAPSLTAGVTSIQAGGFTPFTMTMSREDGNQDLQAITLKMPSGLSGLLTGVKLCPEAQANAGTCGPESQIGETIVSVGLGNEPFTVTGGRVYITEKYDGAPFGLSIVNPANAGPFHLGNVIVRAKIEVNPITAELTVTSDNAGPYKIPTIIDGIPLQIKHVNVTINRPGFTFNPTDCNPTQITGDLHSTEGSTQTLSIPFQATNCATLAFKPGFHVSTSGNTSRANGASLSVKLTYPKAPFGSQANIKSVKVDLPKQLPSRLTTLQKACTAKTFESDPAGCPAESIVGHASAITPLIPVPLSGPAYFVSYGGAKFPELVIVLQGYGVTLDLHGETFISKAGITSSTFHTIPDAPVGSFELTLPQGKYSALAANGNLCKSKLSMPTLFDAQNGMLIKQSTPITVTGCPKKKAKTKKAAKAKKSGKHRKGKPHGKK